MPCAAEFSTDLHWMATDIVPAQRGWLTVETSCFHEQPLDILILTEATQPAAFIHS